MFLAGLGAGNPASRIRCLARAWHRGEQPSDPIHGAEPMTSALQRPPDTISISLGVRRPHMDLGMHIQAAMCSQVSSVRQIRDRQTLSRGDEGSAGKPTVNTFTNSLQNSRSFTEILALLGKAGKPSILLAEEHIRSSVETPVVYFHWEKPPPPLMVLECILLLPSVFIRIFKNCKLSSGERGQDFGRRSLFSRICHLNVKWQVGATGQGP